VIVAALARVDHGPEHPITVEGDEPAVGDHPAAPVRAHHTGSVVLPGHGQPFSISM
jgi:hypothetical protein